MEIAGWAIWLTVAGLLLITEILTGTFFIICFGLGALVASGLAIAGLGTGIQWAAFTLVSFFAVVFVKRFADKIEHQPDVKVGIDRFIGAKAIVVETIDHNLGTGRVRVKHEQWRAQSQGGVVIGPDQLVEVVGVQGTHLIVEPTDS